MSLLRDWGQVTCQVIYIISIIRIFTIMKWCHPTTRAGRHCRISDFITDTWKRVNQSSPGLQKAGFLPWSIWACASPTAGNALAGHSEYQYFWLAPFLTRFIAVRYQYLAILLIQTKDPRNYKLQIETREYWDSIVRFQFLFSFHIFLFYVITSKH